MQTNLEMSRLEPVYFNQKYPSFSAILPITRFAYIA